MPEKQKDATEEYRKSLEEQKEAIPPDTPPEYREQYRKSLEEQKDAIPPGLKD